MRRVTAVLAATALALPAGAAPATTAAQDVRDPLADGEAVDPQRLAGSARDLEPGVRDLEPGVRDLEPRVRELRTEVREGTQTTVTISSDVLFDFDSAELTETAQQVVADLADRVAGSGGVVAIVGHTDSIGSREYNQDLSERRAEAVAVALREHLGADLPLRTEGRAFDEPIEPNTIGGEDNPEGRARNRRVEISFDE